MPSCLAVDECAHLPKPRSKLSLPFLLAITTGARQYAIVMGRTLILRFFSSAVSQDSCKAIFLRSVPHGSRGSACVTMTPT